MERKYSVLMSIYREEQPEFFIQSLESMINQTLIPDEIVLVKDGKLTAALDEIIERYQLSYPDLFKVISLEKNIGLARALDYGLNHCKNELVARMDTDDISLPNRCGMQVEKFMGNPDLCIVGTMIDEFNDNPENIVSSRIVPVSNDEIVRFIKKRNPFNHPTVMYKKSEVLNAGGYGIMRRSQDYDLFSRMINMGCAGANINDSLLLFRSNDESYKRRKNWATSIGRIKVQYIVWTRGHCSFLDLIYVVVMKLGTFLVPMGIFKIISDKLLRVSISNRKER